MRPKPLVRAALLLRRAAAVCAVAGALACDDPAAPVAVALPTHELTVLVGDTAHLAATASRGGTALGAPSFTWTSSDTAVARVDAQGVVWTLHTGTATVRVSEHGGRDSVRVMVRDPDPVVWKQVVTSRSSTCGLQADGRLYCWLTQPDRGGFVAPDLRFTALTPGNYTGACALSTDGSLYCHHDNEVPALFAQIARGEHFRQFAGTFEYGCGIVQDGRTMCWSGDGAPVPLAGDPGLAQVSVSTLLFGQYGCGVTAAGTAYCWGSGASGVLGDGLGTSHAAAAPVAGSVRFSRVEMTSGGACGLSVEGEAYCWGDNAFLQLGFARTTRVGCMAVPTPAYPNAYLCKTPQQVTTQLRFSEIRPDGQRTCGLATDGKAYCWGMTMLRSLGVSYDAVAARPGSSQCGLVPQLPCTSIPIAEQSGRSYVSLSASQGAYHSCGIDAQGAAWCWGDVHPDGTPWLGLDVFGQIAGQTPAVRLREPTRIPNTG